MTISIVKIHFNNSNLWRMAFFRIPEIYIQVEKFDSLIIECNFFINKLFTGTIYIYISNQKIKLS
jgi:hypothetical protein